jgi:hypothetical protein
VAGFGHMVKLAGSGEDVMGVVRQAPEQLINEEGGTHEHHH